MNLVIKWVACFHEQQQQLQSCTIKQIPERFHLTSQTCQKGFCGLYVQVGFSPIDVQRFKPGFINSQAGRGNSCYLDNSNSAHDFREVPVGVTKHLVQSTVQIILTDMISIYVISTDDETHYVHRSGFMNQALSFGDCKISKTFCIISIKFARI